MVAHLLVTTSALALQIIAVNGLGVEGFGRYVVMLGVIALATTVSSAWVGDSLSDFDRLDPADRGALVVMQASIGAFAGGVGFVLSVALGLGGLGVSTLFAAVVIASVLHDLARRALMATRSGAALVVNDGWYGVLAVGFALWGWRLGAELSIEILLFAMLAAASTACVLAVVQIPVEERILARWEADGLADVVYLGALRAVRPGLGPAVVLAVRILVVVMASATALGRLEAARLLLSPLLAAGQVMASRVRSQRSPNLAVADAGALGRVTLALAAGATGYALVVLAFQDRLASTLLGVDLDRVSVGSWALLSVAYVAGLPAASVLVSHGRTLRLFLLRQAASIILIVLAVLFLIDEAAELVPLGGAVGVLVSTVLLLWAALVTLGTAGRPTSAVVDVRDRSRGLVANAVVGVGDRSRGLVANAVVDVRDPGPATAGGDLDDRLPSITSPMVHPSRSALAAVHRGLRVQLHRLAHAYLVVVASAVVLAAGWAVLDIAGLLGELGWPFDDPRVSGGYLVFAVVIGAAHLGRRPAVSWAWRPGGYVLSTAICSAALLATGADGSIVAALAGVSVVVFASARLRTRTDLLVVGVPLVGFVLAAFPAVSDSIADADWRLPLGSSSAAALVGTLVWVGVVAACAVALGRRLRRSRFDPDIPLLAGLLTAVVLGAVATDGPVDLSVVALAVVAVWTLVLVRGQPPERRSRLRAQPVVIATRNP